MAGQKPVADVPSRKLCYSLYVVPWSQTQTGRGCCSKSLREKLSGFTGESSSETGPYDEEPVATSQTNLRAKRVGPESRMSIHHTQKVQSSVAESEVQKLETQAIQTHENLMALSC